MILAAETSRIFASAFGKTETNVSYSVPTKKFCVPSIIISENDADFPSLVSSKFPTARRAASFSALLSPISSNSSAGTQPSPVSTPASRASLLKISLLSFSRFFSVSFLESASKSTHSNFSPTGKTTAPITSGPAHGPRPTSSIPKIVIHILYM